MATKKQLYNSQLTSYLTYLMYRNECLSEAQNVFTFKGLPDSIDKKFLNRTLLYSGAIAFFYDEVLKKIIALPFTIRGNLDYQGNPTTIMARSYNGRYYRKLNQDEYIIMYDNNSYESIISHIVQRAERLAYIKRAIDINVTQQKTPRIWQCNSDQVQSLKSLLNEIDGMAEKVATYDNLDLEEIQNVLNPAPFVADKLRTEFEKERAEFLSLIGVASLIEQKKERMIQDEISVSQGGTIINRFCRFEPRADAIEKINKKWNLNISVEFYDGLPTTMKADESEVIEDESL